MRHSSVFWVLLLSFSMATAQEWDWVLSSHSAKRPEINTLCSNRRGDLFLSVYSAAKCSLQNIALDSGRYLLKVSDCGEIRWARKGTFISCESDLNGGALGIINAKPLNYYPDMFLVKLSTDGVEEFRFSVNSMALTGLTSDLQGNYFISGYPYSDTLKLHDVTFVIPSGSFIMKLNPSNKTVWVRTDFSLGKLKFSGVGSICSDERGSLKAEFRRCNGDTCNYYFGYLDSLGQVSSARFFYHVVFAPYINIVPSMLNRQGRLFWFYYNGYRYQNGTVAGYTPEGKLRSWFDLGGTTVCEVNQSFDIDKQGNIIKAKLRYPHGEGYCFDGHLSYDFSIEMYDTTGKQHWRKTVKSEGNESVTSILTDQNGGCFVTGIFNFSRQNGSSVFGTPLWFDDISVQSSSGEAEFFIAKLKYVRTPKYGGSKPESTNDVAREFFIYPNPASAVLQTYSPQDGEITIRDLFGSAIYNGSAPKGFCEIPVDTFVPGYYFLQWTSADRLTELRRNIVIAR